MKIRCALVAYARNYGAASAARKFDCSIPTVYQWRDKLMNHYHYWALVILIAANGDYDSYVNFN